MTNTAIEIQDLKMHLYRQCIDYVTHHIEINQRMVTEAHEAVTRETKSTAGDRYETERAMKQRETELFGKRIEDALRQHATLLTIDAKREYTTVQPGALATTSAGIFFIAISSDEVIINGEEYCLISIDSPIGNAMAGKRAGDIFLFRGNSITIDTVQ